MATRVLLVRHGATQLTAEDRFSGAVGVDLSDDGRFQAQRLAVRLSREPIRAVYASPLSRTMDTADEFTRLDQLYRDGQGWLPARLADSLRAAGLELGPALGGLELAPPLPDC